MSVALQDAQICAPGPHSFAILVSHYTRYLMHVRKIMNCPVARSCASVTVPKAGCFPWRAKSSFCKFSSRSETRFSVRTGQTRLRAPPAICLRSP